MKANKKISKVALMRLNRKRQHRGAQIDPDEQNIIDLDDELFNKSTFTTEEVADSLSDEGSIPEEGAEQKLPVKPDIIETPVDLPEWQEMNCIRHEVLKNLERRKFLNPTEIQKECIPDAINAQCDIIGAAETGSGKTLAFAIPIVTNMLNYLDAHHFKRQKRPWLGLVLSPTRELALQIEKHFKRITEGTELLVGSIIGGMNQDKQMRMLRKRPHILIATPGRLWQFIEQKECGIERLYEIKWLAIDEADRMIEKGHFAEVKKIISFINAPNNVGSIQNFKRQMFVFSATLTFIYFNPGWGGASKMAVTDNKGDSQSLKKKIFLLMKELQVSQNVKVVDVTTDFGTATKLSESRVLCKADQKMTVLYYLLMKYPGRTLVFANSINHVKLLCRILRRLRLDGVTMTLHASMPQRQRLKNIDRFAQSKEAILVATDVAARGLDIPNIEHIFHYEMPRTTENYIHRSGRTARMNQSGISIALVAKDNVEDSKNYWKISTNLGWKQDLPLFPLPTFESLSKIHNRVLLAIEIDRCQSSIDRDAKEVQFRRKTRGESFESDVSDYGTDSENEDNRKRRKLGKGESGYTQLTDAELSKLRKTATVLQKRLEVFMKQPISVLGNETCRLTVTSINADNNDADNDDVAGRKESDAILRRLPLPRPEDIGCSPRFAPSWLMDNFKGDTQRVAKATAIDDLERFGLAGETFARTGVGKRHAAATRKQLRAAAKQKRLKEKKAEKNAKRKNKKQKSGK